MLWTLPQINWLPPLAGHILAVWLPVLFSGLLFAVTTNDLSPPKLVRTLRILAVAVLAPFLAFNVYMFLGFTLLEWQM